MSDIIFQPLGAAVTDELGLGEVADIDPRLTRTHYFDGRLLTADDLTRDQLYLDQRLREVGSVLGDGILSGLALSFDVYTGHLRLGPGKGVTAAGRVLELSQTLEVDLGDRAVISGLNNGAYRRFNRGLYAVVLSYVEVATDVAEVFPQDLGDKRGVEYDLITESVQLGLVPLPVALPQQSQIQIRSWLMRELYGDHRFQSVVPEDAVALGVLAIRDDRPQWLDDSLLRRPLSQDPTLSGAEADLSRQYEKLFQDVLTTRRSGGLTGDFAASSYFSLLPPTGAVPKEGIDPVNGRQGFFPETFQVWIAPIRQSDVALIKAESMALPPIDLRAKEPVNVVVLAPLSNQEYGYYASRLEQNPNSALRRLPQLDLLRLKLHPSRPVHQLDTDAGVWQAIWGQIDESDLFFVRRPTRAAETAISGIVLALGTQLPAAPPALPSPADSGGLLEDEESVLLRHVNFSTLSTQRSPTDSEGESAVTSLIEEFSDDAAAVLASLSILLRVEPRYDTVVWQTLLALARADALAGFSQALSERADDPDPTGEKVAAIGTTLGLDAALLAAWTTLDP